EALTLLLREMTSTGTSMSPGTTGGGGGRAAPSPVVRLFSFYVDKKTITPMVHFGGESWTVPLADGEALNIDAIERPKMDAAGASGDITEVPLIKIAHGRSGDKGSNANIGIIARKPEFLPMIREQITVEAVAEYFSHFLEGEVDRFDLPGINGVNFLLHEVLGGGGIASLRQDPQGKAYAQMLLDHPVQVPNALLDA
ncbi:MAG: terpene utilization protein AtuA, partial [Candidatus Hydrogenedentota bacterium]